MLQLLFRILHPPPFDEIPRTICRSDGAIETLALRKDNAAGGCEKKSEVNLLEEDIVAPFSFGDIKLDELCLMVCFLVRFWLVASCLEYNWETFEDLCDKKARNTSSEAVCLHDIIYICLFVCSFVCLCFFVRGNSSTRSLPPKNLLQSTSKK